MSSEGSKSMSGEYHSLVASQLPQTLEEICSTTSYNNLMTSPGTSAPCSAVGSREALGSSNNSIPAEDSVSVSKERMNVRELVKQSAYELNKSRV
jgi:hypothetical protein